ncbi:MAG: AraC family transcriptional regulator [Ginsengibacter sp.]
MKIKKEIVQLNPGQSFKLFTPRLKNYFFWHYHPEYELVYVEAANGIRHVGQNISGFMGNDLVLIGSNIPHLNFDYGLKTAYRQIVVQLKQNFLGDAIKETVELSEIEKLFDRAYLGLSFHGETKKIVAEKLDVIQKLPPFQQLLSLLEIFQVLATSREVIELNQQDTSVKLFLNDKIRMGAIYKYIDANYNENPDVNKVASNVNLSAPAFCRYFKKQTRMTFTEFVNQYRVNQSKTLLLQGLNVSEACYETGFESLSYFNKIFKKITGVNPSAFKKQYALSL